MPRQTLHFFVSSTTSDLGNYRRVVRDQLQKRGIFPVTQEDFLPDHREIVEILKDKIVRCDAVICLIGFAFGAAPKKGGDALRSYTQLEYDIALDVGKPIYLFLATEQCPVDSAPDESLEQLASQRKHREMIQGADQLYCEFSSKTELRQKITEIDLPELSGSDRLPFYHEHTPPIPAYFHGRKFELAQLEEAISEPEPSVIAVIGIGGQGKTTLVAHWLNSHHHRAFAAGYWCTAYRGGFTFDAFVDGILSYLTRGSFDKRGHQSLADRTTLLMAKLKEYPVLMVIDGIERWLRGWHQEEIDISGATTVERRRGYIWEVDRFLEEVSGLRNGTHLVMTTRALPEALDGLKVGFVPVLEEGRDVAALEGIDDQAAIDLLYQLGVRGEPDALLDEAKKHGKHPLALTVLGRLLKKRYGGRLDGLKQMSPVQTSDRLRQLLDTVRESLPNRTHAELFLHVAANCYEDPTLETVVAGLGGETAAGSADLADARNCAVDLDDWNVIDFDPSDDVVHLHALVKEYFAARTPDPAQIHDRLYKSYAEHPVKQSSSVLHDAKTRILAIRHALRAGRQEECRRLSFGSFTSSYSFVNWLVAWGHLDAGVELLSELATASSGELKGEFNMSKAVMLSLLGQFGAAESTLDQAVDLTGKLVQGGSREAGVSMAKGLISRSNVRYQRKRYTESLADLDHALNLLDQHGTESDLTEYAEAFISRGNTLAKLGHPSDATESYHRADAILGALKGFGDFRPALADTSMNRGIAHLSLEKPLEAISDLENALATYELLIDEGRTELVPKRARVMIMLGAAYNRHDQSSDAATILDNAIQELKQLVDDGRKDLEPLLSLAHLNRVHTHLHDRRFQRAIEESNHSVRFYAAAVAKGQLEFRGLHSHALLDRAEATYRLKRFAESELDRKKGLELSERCIDEGDTSLHRPRLEKILRIVEYLGDDHLCTFIPDVSNAVGDIHTMLGASHITEYLEIGTRTSLPILEFHRDRLVKAGLDWSIVQSIRENLTHPPSG